MKRILAIILAILLLCACSVLAEEAPAAGPETVPYSPAGTWYGQTNGFVITLALQEDGTYTASVAGGEEIRGAWALKDGNVVLDGDGTLSFTLIGDTLISSDSGLSFTRQQPEVYVPAPVTDVNVAELEGIRVTRDFDGAWKSAFILTGGAAVPADSLGDNTILYFETHRGLIVGDQFGQIAADFNLEDNALRLEDGELSFLVQMQEDGNLRFTVNAGDAELVYIMVPYLVEEFPLGEETDEKIPGEEG